MWKILESQRNSICREIDKLNIIKDEISKEMENVEKEINNDINRELRVFIRKLGINKNIKLKIDFGHVSSDDYVNIYYKDEEKEKETIYMYRNMMQTFRAMQKIRKRNDYACNLYISLDIYSKYGSSRSSLERSYFLRTENFENKKEDELFLFLICNNDTEKLFRDLFLNMYKILSFIEEREYLHKNNDIISTRKSVLYLIKNYKSSKIICFSYFPKDIIIMICKKALTF